MEFFRKIYLSVYSPKFYKTIPKSSFGSAFLYFFIIIVILTVFRVAPLVYSFATSAQVEISKGVKESAKYYPKDLVVSIKNGKVSTNVKEPYAIKNPGDVDEEHKNLVVIDTKSPFSLEKFKEYKTFAWVTQEALYIQSQSEVRAYDLSEVDDFKLDRKQVEDVVSMISPWVPLLTPVIAVFLIFGMLIFYALRLIYLFFLALLIHLMSRIAGWGFTYKESYKIGMYAITLPLFLEIIQTYLPVLQIPFLFTVIALGVVFLNFKDSKTVNTKK